jgi:DNA adenine methylase
MKAPIRYFGGKGGMLNRLITMFPADCRVYVEPYGGAGSVLLGKPRHPIEIYNDLERNVYTLFKVLADPVMFERFRHLCELAFYDKALSDEYRLTLRCEGVEPVQRAFMFWYVNHTRRNGIGGFSINGTIRRRMSKSVSDFLSSVEGLPALHARLSGVVITNFDALTFFEEHDRANTFMYLDPPYVQSTRGHTRYVQDADDAHHNALIDRLLGLKKAKVLLSGYDNLLYERLTGSGWSRRAFVVHTQDGTNAPKDKTEVVWMNYQTQKVLL